MGDFAQVAQHALPAAHAGAKVLVVRNTVQYAIDTQQTVETMMTRDDSNLLYACRGVLTLHHGRFAREALTGQSSEELYMTAQGLESWNQVGVLQYPAGAVLVGIGNIAGGFEEVFLSGWEHISSGNMENDSEVSTMSGFSTMHESRDLCMKLVEELPDAALPEAIETLTDLRDHYRSLENPSIRRPTPPLEHNVKPRVLSVE